MLALTADSWRQARPQLGKAAELLEVGALLALVPVVMALTGAFGTATRLAARLVL